jgi:hypothetical protein
MSTAPVGGLEQDAGGNPIAGVIVSFSLYAADPPEVVYGAEGQEIDTTEPPVSVSSGSDGTWSIALERTDTMTPSGQLYQVDRIIGEIHQAPAFITVPAGGGPLWQLLAPSP